MFGCLGKLVLWAAVLLVCIWAFMAAMNPWALHMGRRTTPFLFWHGAGTVIAKDGKKYQLYVSFSPGRPQGFRGIGRREGKTVSADLTGTGWLCVKPGVIQRLNLSGTMYGGYASSDQSLFDFRLLEWRKPFSIDPQTNRGFFDIAGMWRGTDLVMDRPNEQGVRFLTGPFIDNATVTLRPASYDEFQSACH